MPQPALYSSSDAGDRAQGWPDVDRAFRVACTVAEILIVESVVCGLAALPSALLWARLASWTSDTPGLRAVIAAAFVVPSYVLFALLLIACSAVATRLTGARTVSNAEWPIRDLGWPLLRWVRYMVATHIVRIVAGWLFRASPVWTAYLRLNGARIGRGVYVNTLSITDHNLLELGDGVVIGENVHVSGHTVERGVVKTGRVTLAAGVTVGIGSVIGIDVDAGRGCQVGALSLVPKHSRLHADSVYAGIPVHRMDGPRQ